MMPAMYWNLCVTMMEKNNSLKSFFTTKERWITSSLFCLLFLTCLGSLLRLKFVFDLPQVDYVKLLDSHSHFAFTGWVGLVLMVLLASNLLDSNLFSKSIYGVLFFLTVSLALLMGIAFGSPVLAGLGKYGPYGYIFITYIFAFQFLKDLKISTVSPSVRILAMSAMCCLVLSSIGPITLGYLFETKSPQLVWYKNALFTYLHLQYNGFFTLSVFALLFHKMDILNYPHKKSTLTWFAILLSATIIPSLFLAYLWTNPSIYIKVIAFSGSVLLGFCFVLFTRFSWKHRTFYYRLPPLVKFLFATAFIAFGSKTLLQSLTIFSSISDPVFGNRAVIMGFLHLVFLGFVTLFILGFLALTEHLNLSKVLTKIGLVIFCLGVIFNETLLGLQGLGNLFIKSSSLFPPLLLICSILLFLGALLVFLSRVYHKPNH